MKKRELKREVATLRAENVRLSRILSVVTILMTSANLFMTIARVKSKRSQQGDAKRAQK